MPNFLINVKEKGAKKASKNIGGLNTALGGLASKAALAAGAFVGGGMLLSGMKKAIDLAGEQEKAEKTLETALGRRSQGLLDQARALQQVTTFGDEAIISAQALIGAFVNDEEQIKLATAATLDLAAAKGMDLTVAADLVSKTLGSSTNAMSRYGIQVTGAVGSTERLESLTNNLANVFGGQASAQAETMSGKLAQMTNALGDAGEAFGSLLFPLVIPLAEGLKLIGESGVNIIEAFEGLSDGTSKVTDDVVIATKAMADEAQTLDELEIVFREVKDAMKELIPESKNFDDAMKIANNSGDLVKSTFDGLKTTYLDLKGRIRETKIGLEEGSIEWALYKSAIDPVTISQREFNREQTNWRGNLKKIVPLQMTTMSFWDISTLAIKRNTLERAKNVKENLKGYALTTAKASDAMKSVVKAESMEAIAGFIASIFKTVPFPLNAVLAAGAGATVSGLIDQGLSQIPSFATGGDFVTNGKQLIEVGDNPSGRERVQITPLGGDPAPNAPSGASVTVNVSGNVMSQDYVEGELAEQIKEAIRRGNDFGVS